MCMCGTAKVVCLDAANLVSKDPCPGRQVAQVCRAVRASKPVSLDISNAGAANPLPNSSAVQGF